MKTSEKIIKRMNEAFGFDIPKNAFVTTHIKRYGHNDHAFSWGISFGTHDIGSSCSMTECLKWDKWVFSPSLHEIFEYIPNSNYSSEDLIERPVQE